MISYELGAFLAPAISAVVVTLLYHYLGREYLGADENGIWNRFRRTVLAGFDPLVQENTDFILTNHAKAAEFVGTFEWDSPTLAHKLEDAGYLQGVFSGLKLRDGDVEAGSMVYRESKSSLIPDALAFYQVHVFWFENDDGTVDVYAHYEYSSLNPVVAWKHYRAIGQDPDEGVARVLRVLDYDR